MASPINTPLAGEIWHLSIEDLFAPVHERHRLGGDGPFVINLSVSTAPITVPTKTFAGFQDAHVYLIQVTEDGRMRYRLRLGPFASEDDADAILEEVRDIYPGALTATAIPADLRTIATLQAKFESMRASAKRAAEKLVEEITIDLPPAPATLIPTVDEEPMDLEKLLHAAASPAMTPPPKAVKAAAAKATAAPAPEVEKVPQPKAASALPASGPPVSEPPLELSPEWAIPVLNTRVVPVKESRPAADVAPVITKSPDTFSVWADKKPASASASKPAAPIPAMPIPKILELAPLAPTPQPIVAASTPMLTTSIISAPPAPAAAPAQIATATQPVAAAPTPMTASTPVPVPVVPAAAETLAPLLTEVVATRRTVAPKPGRALEGRAPEATSPTPPPVAPVPTVSAPTKSVAPAPARRAMAPMTKVTQQVVMPPVVMPPVVTVPVMTMPVVTTPVMTSPTVSTPPVTLRGITVPAVTAKPPQPVATPAAPVRVELPTPPLAGSATESVPRQVKQLDEPLENLEFTQTVRALTPPELEVESLRWYVIQLALSDHAFDPDAVPNLDIFSEYRLYSVAGMDQGRAVHALRLGFFTEEIGAVAVASYLAAYYEKPTIRRVSVAERQRFMHQRVEARKDVGATGAHAVIEITNELVARYRRTPAPTAPSDSSQTGDRWVPSPR